MLREKPYPVQHVLPIDEGPRSPGPQTPGGCGAEERGTQDSFRVQTVSEDPAGSDHVLSVEQVLALLHEDLSRDGELLPDGARMALDGDGGRGLGQHDVGAEFQL